MFLVLGHTVCDEFLQIVMNSFVPSSLLQGIGHIARAIRFVRAERASTDGTFPHVAWACFEFTGRSLFNLRTELARRLNFAVVSDVIMCVRAGLFGRLTPLITDLPPNNVTMEIIVVTAGTIGEISFLCTCVLLVIAFSFHDSSIDYMLGIP